MMLRPGTFLQDRYEIQEQIGSGGMSGVYRAKCHKLNRLVAIKVLKEEFCNDMNFVSKFKMEAQAAAGLSHPNIVSVYDVIDEGKLHYIVMELIEGITLKSYIAKKGQLEIKESIGIAIQVAQGMAAAHEQHIIHRDIKPQNMIISRDGKVKVADFGIARAVSAQTLNSAAMGSVHYISPEQARGGFSDERSDIYSLGITMYEMVTGRLPYEGENTVAIALAHLEDAMVPPSVYNPQIPQGLERIILKCTEKKPERTFTREDVNKMIAAEVGKALQKQQEADRLANMTEAERVQHEHDEAIRRADEAEQALNAYKLQAEASKLANAAGLPLEFLDTIDFRTAKAETVKGTVENLASVFKKAVEAAVNERLKQPAPKTVAAQVQTERQRLEKQAADLNVPLAQRVAAKNKLFSIQKED